MRSSLLFCAFLGIATITLTHCVGDDPASSGNTNPTDGGGGTEGGGQVDANTPGTDAATGMDSSTPVDAATDAKDAAPHDKIAFVTSERYNGRLDPVGGPAGAGGVAAGDARCNAVAAAPYPGRTFKAWLATAATSASARIGTGPWYSGTMLIGGTTELTTGALKVALNLTQAGVVLTTADTAWTGTLGDGTYSTNSSCVDWTSIANTDDGAVGTVSGSDVTWTAAGDLSCDTTRRLYCFEQ